MNDASGQCHASPIELSEVVATRSTVEDGALLVRLGGELDLAGRDVVADACTAGGHMAVTVDLCELTFMDCAGYFALETARRIVTGRGGTFSLANANGEPARLLAMIDDPWSSHDVIRSVA